MNLLFKQELVQDVANALPKVQQTSFLPKAGSQTWQLYYYQEYTDVLLAKEELKNQVVEALLPLTRQEFPFRQMIHLQSCPFLASIFPQERAIRLYSNRMSRELALIHHFPEVSASEEDRKSFAELKSYAEKTLSFSSKDSPSIYETIAKICGLRNLLADQDYLKVCERAGGLTERLLYHLNSYRPTWFEKLSDYGLGLTAQYALLRIHLLKFLAILPSLDHDKSGKEVKRILLESLRRLLQDSAKARRNFKTGQEKALPENLLMAIRPGYKIARLVPAYLLAKIVRFSVKLMAKRFIAGETIEKAQKSFAGLFSSGRDVTLDQLGELVVSEAEADHYMQEVLKLISGFSLYFKQGEKNAAGINRAHVSIKVSALAADMRPEDLDYTYQLIAPRLRKILLLAQNRDVFINIDAEHYHYRDLVFKIYQRVLLETPELENFAATGIVLQAYLRDAAGHLQEIIDLAEKRKLRMPIRLVKGAYWDAETVEGEAHSFNPPQFLNKEETDLNFRELIYKIFEASPHVQLCLASHNFSDHSFAEQLRNDFFQDLPAIEHQCLHMTYEALSTAMAKMEWPVRNYVPVGGLLVGMAYLVRRIMENSSQVGILTIMRSHKKKHHLIGPHELHQQKKEHGELARDIGHSHFTDAFFNVPPVRTYLEQELAPVKESYQNFKQQSLNKEYDNSFLLNAGMEEIYCSSDPSIVVGSIRFGDEQDAVRVVDYLDDAYTQGVWSLSSVYKRSITLIKAAHIMLAQRNHLAALISYEAGKSVKEALGDVDEAIDFLDFYAREELTAKSSGVNNLSRGVVAVIAPWNFPLAIPCGMVSAALAAGNTVVLKSAEQTPLIAQLLVDILHQAGVPKNALVHLPGRGEIVGKAIVAHARVAAIVFTGSKAVGMQISRLASGRIIENKLWGIKFPVKAITEMGGKNAIIVTASAELDETISGILYSAYGHAGQKCSAASRVLVHASLKQRLIERLKDATNDIKVGASFEFSTYINPLISQEDQARVRRQVADAILEAQTYNGKCHVDRSKEDLPGYCVGPVVIELPSSRLRDPSSMSRQELFAPVIHVLEFETLPQAVALFNATDYALTGGVFGQSQDDIDFLADKLESGNLYINRPITGARVAIEPFGGFKLSGTGPKAGGKQYLNSFHIRPVNLPLLHELSFKTPKIEIGKDEEVLLARPSGLSVRRRLPRVLAGVSTLANNFEFLFQGIYAENKIQLLEFAEFLKKEASNFYLRGEKNRIIPGQLSYNSYFLCSKYLVIVGMEERAHFITLLQLISALTSGVGVTILSTNESAFHFWYTVHRYFVQAGISGENFSVFFSKPETNLKLLKHPLVEHVLIDADIESTEKLMQTIYDIKDSELNDWKLVKKIHSPFDAPSIGEHERLLQEFVHTRSFAVNTMRHGAPLNLDN